MRNWRIIIKINFYEKIILIFITVTNISFGQSKIENWQTDIKSVQVYIDS